MVLLPVAIMLRVLMPPSIRREQWAYRAIERKISIAPLLEKEIFFSKMREKFVGFLIFTILRIPLSWSRSLG